MGRRSTRENKTIYQTSRENAGLSREAAAEAMVYISSDRIEKIEYEISAPHPEEVLAMAECYKAPALCNHYCSHSCPIGQEYVPEVEAKDLSRITLEILAGLNTLEKERNRLVEITVDGVITPEEMPDFQRIREALDKMAMTVDSLRLWMDQSVLNADA